MFDFLRSTKSTPDQLLARDEDYWDVVTPERFAKVVEAQGHLLGFDAAGRVVTRIKVPTCVGETYDWDTQHVVACPDHAGFCPGERSVFS